MFEPEIDEDFESFEKFRKAPKTGKIPEKSDHQIRTARKVKERAKQAVLLEEAESTI
jgi:hypothetical protein